MAVLENAMARCMLARRGRYLKPCGITARIARHGGESTGRLGQHRWVAERMRVRFAGFGELRIRLERRIDIHLALLSLAAAVICSHVGKDGMPSTVIISGVAGDRGRPCGS